MLADARTDPFAAALGAGRGTSPTSGGGTAVKPAGAPLATVAPGLDYETLANATYARWHDVTRTWLARMGVRPSRSEHLCFTPGYATADGYVVHVRAHATASYVYCASRDEYGSWDGQNRGMQAAPRGSFREPGKTRGPDGSRYGFTACRSCQRAFQRETAGKTRHRWDKDVARDMREKADYPALPKPQRKAFLVALAHAIRQAPTVQPDPDPAALHGLCDGAYRRAVVRFAADLAYASHDDALRRLVPGYEALRNQLPHVRGPHVALALPMMLCELLPQGDYERVIADALPATPQETPDWKTASARAGARIAARVQRLLALRTLAATADADW